MQKTTCPICRCKFNGAERVLHYTPDSVVLEHLKSELRARVRQERDDALLAASLGGSV